MEWYLFALLSAFTGVLVNLIDKWILTNKIRDAVAYQIFLAPFYIMAVGMSFQFLGPTTWDIALLAMAAGAVLGIANILYNKALLHEEASKVVDMFYLDAIFILPLAALFLGEVLTPAKYLGIFFVVAAAAFVSYKKDHGRFVFSKALWFMIVLDVISAFVWIANKYLVDNAQLFTIIFWTFVGTMVGRLSLLLVPSIRAGFAKQMVHMRGLTLVAGFGTAFFAFLSVYFWFSALQQQFVSLANAVLAAQPFMLLVVALALSRLGINVGEDTSLRNEELKVLAAVLLFAGMWLIIQ